MLLSKFLSVFTLVLFGFFSLFFSGCSIRGVKPVEDEKIVAVDTVKKDSLGKSVKKDSLGKSIKKDFFEDNSTLILSPVKNEKNVPVDIVKKEKSVKDEKISFLEIDKNFSKKTYMICKQEERRFLVDMINIISNNYNYDNSLDLYHSLPKEKRDYFRYYVTVHLHTIGCIKKDIPINDSIVLEHSLVNINPKQNVLYANFCQASEKIFISRKISDMFNKKLTYKESLPFLKKLNSYKRGSIKLEVTNFLSGIDCVDKKE